MKRFLLLLALVSSAFGTNFNQIPGNTNVATLWEPPLGNPSVTGYVLSSTTGGVRSWIAAGTGGGSVSITATAPIVVTPSPLIGTGTVSLDPTTKTNWDTAFSERRQWDGGGTNLIASTGRTSLGATTLGSNFLTATNPSAIRFFRSDASNNLIQEDATTHRTSIGAGTGSGSVTSIATTSPVQGGTISTTGTISLNLATDFAWTAAQSITLTNANTVTSDTVLQLVHNTSGTAAVGFGTTIWSRLENASGSTVDGGQIQNNWTTATAGSETSNWLFLLRNAGGGLGTKMSISGAGVVDSAGGFTVSGTAIVPTGGSTGQVLTKNSGTSYDASWLSKSQVLFNSSTGDNTGFASDQYLTGSAVTVPAGGFTVGAQYRCRFDMVKTNAGTSSLIVAVRIGTTGTTSDSQWLLFNFGAGTAVADTGEFEVIVNFRTAGSSATVMGYCRASHNLATTGLFNNAAIWTITGITTTNDASAATKIGVSVNGGASFSGTNKVVQATLTQ